MVMAEKKWIDANALDAELETLMVRFAALGRKKVAEDYNFVRTVLDNAPTVDAVEVVRCKDCSYWDKATVNKNGFLICPASGMEITEGDFCSYGERRTDG